MVLQVFRRRWKYGLFALRALAAPDNGLFLFSGKLFIIKLHYIHSFKYGGVQL
jgi:hypothetical protein